MRRQKRLVGRPPALLGGLGVVVLATLTPQELAAQPVSVEVRPWHEPTLRPEGQPVVPIFEGWFPNSDGTRSLCFGYFNLNTATPVDIPLGAANRIEPARFDGMQPTRFTPVPASGHRRSLCVFTIRVPADFGALDRVVWTLRSAGQTLSVPGYLHRGYELDEPASDGRGDVAPVLRLEAGGPAVQGRNGMVAAPRTVAAGEALELAVEVDHPALGSWVGWAVHQGPALAVFEDTEIKASGDDGVAATTVTFTEPGEYLLRVQAIDAISSFEFHCCWTNAYVPVTVTGGIAGAEPRPLPAPTFTRDVAPILQRSCQQCHNPAGMAPMSLVTYEEARRWAPLIRERVVSRVMPPWHLDPTVGIQAYQNDISLSAEEIRTVARWADAGAPRGDPADMPPPVTLPRGDAWQLEEKLGPPDMIIRSAPYTVIADGQDQWWTPSVPFEGLDETRWLRAAEFKPSYPLGLRVVHHGHAVLIQPGRGTAALARYGVGKTWEMFPEGVGMRINPEEGRISWDLHYFPIGQVVPDDVVEVGLWFYPPGEEPRLETAGEVMFRVDRMGGMPRGGDILIPPHGYQTLQGVHVLQRAAVLHSFRPHAHMRAREMAMEAIHPDGRREILSKVDNYDHNWQIAYLYEDHARPLLPRGTVLLFTTVFDNTANNPINPAPDQWVVFGRRGVDEMSHAWVGITYLEDEDYERLVAEREARERERGLAAGAEDR